MLLPMQALMMELSKAPAEMNPAPEVTTTKALSLYLANSKYALTFPRAHLNRDMLFGLSAYTLAENS